MKFTLICCLSLLLLACSTGKTVTKNQQTYKADEPKKEQVYQVAAPTTETDRYTLPRDQGSGALMGDKKELESQVTTLEEELLALDLQKQQLTTEYQTKRKQINQNGITEETLQQLEQRLNQTDEIIKDKSTQLQGKRLILMQLQTK